MKPQSRNTIAFVAAASFGFVALAALDAWRSSGSWFERLNVWLLGFAAARALGVFVGVPLRQAARKQVTTRGLLSVVPMSLGALVLACCTLLSVLASALGIFESSWDFDLMLSGVAAATLPLFLLSVWLDR